MANSIRESESKFKADESKQQEGQQTASTSSVAETPVVAVSEQKAIKHIESENSESDSEMSSITQKLEFCLDKNDWDIFADRLEIYFEAKGIEVN